MVKNPTVLRSCLDALKDPLFVLDQARACVFVNNAFSEYFSLVPDEHGSVPIESFWPDIERVDLSAPEFACELKLERGDVYTVKLASSKMEGGLILIRVLAGISANDTQQNFHAQRLETLGMLASGIAHDFNNVLAGILGHTTYLKTILPGKGPHVESLTAIEDGAKKATTIIQQILNFSRLDSAQKSGKINLCDLVVKTCNLLRRAISPEYCLEPIVPLDSVNVLAVEAKLAQVIVNLVINSRDAVKKSGGRIRVSVDDRPDREHLQEIFHTDDLALTEYAAICVEDNGHGISPEILTRIFEPYFSTKQEKGTGLGLATVAAIVKSFGGVIEVTSEVGVGTRVNVFLPVMNGERENVAAPEATERRLETGTERILVIDDETPVRNVLSVSLQHLGYKVDVASSGVEAIEKFTEGGNRYDLVLLDMLMPVLSGEKVFFKLKAIEPEVKVLVISGFASEQAVNNILKNGGLDFIQKPFTIEELSKRVRSCLDGKARK